MDHKFLLEVRSQFGEKIHMLDDENPLRTFLLTYSGSWDHDISAAVKDISANIDGRPNSNGFERRSRVRCKQFEVSWTNPKGLEPTPINSLNWSDISQLMARRGYIDVIILYVVIFGTEGYNGEPRIEDDKIVR